MYDNPSCRAYFPVGLFTTARGQTIGQYQDHRFRHGRADLRGSVPVNSHLLTRAPDICFLG